MCACQNANSFMCEAWRVVVALVSALAHACHFTGFSVVPSSTVLCCVDCFHLLGEPNPLDSALTQGTPERKGADHLLPQVGHSVESVFVSRSPPRFVFLSRLKVQRSVVQKERKGIINWELVPLPSAIFIAHACVGPRCNFHCSRQLGWLYSIHYYALSLSLVYISRLNASVV